MSSQKKSDGETTPSAGSATSSAKPPKKKFKYTRELVRIALGEGMTQEEIAKTCRVSQPIVSKWAKGKSQGAEQSIAPLLKLYGSRLSRSTARVYLALDDPDPRWENSEIGRQLLGALVPDPEGQDDGVQRPSFKVQLPVIQNLARELNLASFSVNWHDILDLVQVRFIDCYPDKVVEVDGPIIFRHTFSRLEGRLHREGIEPLRSPVARWLLHDGLRGKLVLVRQYRRHLASDELTQWYAQRARQEAVVLGSQDPASFSTHKLLPALRSDWLDSADDAGRWVCRIEHPMSIEELLAFVDDYVNDDWQLHTVHDQKTLPFLVRKALIERRYSVPGVERIADYE